MCIKAVQNGSRVLIFETKCDKMEVVQVLEAHEATTQTLSPPVREKIKGRQADK